MPTTGKPEVPLLTARLPAALLLLLFAGAHAASEPFVQKIERTDVQFKMLSIPAGSFTMGSPTSETGRDADEGPQREVKVDAFFMEEHEVTWDEFNPFLRGYNAVSMKPPVKFPVDKLADAVTFPTPMYDPLFGPELQRMGGHFGGFPAVVMSQYAARQYTKWLSKKTGRFYRLPSEAEWEYAARAGTEAAYFFGDDPAKLGEYAWFKSNSNEADGKPGYHAVMTKKPNRWGLYDMYGNASEWCIDVYDADDYSRPSSDFINWPVRATSPYPRILRGGDFASSPKQCRSAFREASRRSLNGDDPDLLKSPYWLSNGLNVGFRVVSPVHEPAEAEKLRWWDADDEATLKAVDRDRTKRAIVSPGASKR